MKILMLCGVFAPENQQEVIDNARRPVEFSANLFQLRLIRGFRERGYDLSVLSAPFVGSYPNASAIRHFRGFRQSQSLCRYVSFSNIWGYRNFSRAGALKRALADFLADKDPDKRIVVYSAHTPFLEAAAYAKKKNPEIRVCFYVPDLPDYMNLRADRSWIYDVAKGADIRKMNRLMESVDSFVVLTEQMKDRLPVGSKPCHVAEGIITQIPKPAAATEEKEKFIVYTGKLDGAFGVRELVDAMALLPDSDLRLVLCGQGDSFDYACGKAKVDPRIQPLGLVAPEEAAQWQRRAAVLVNPRANVGEYTKYSFPSKNIEYLLSGRPVAACLLDGMPRCYGDFLYTIEGNDPAAIAHGLRRALEDGPQSKEDKYSAFLRYARQSLMAQRIAEKIVDM